MANTLTVVAGPPGGGKYRWMRERVLRDGSLVVIDYQALFAAFAMREPMALGEWPDIQEGDPRRAYVATQWFVAVERAAETGQRGFVTTSDPSRIDGIERLAQTNRVQVFDPGRAVAESRIMELYEELDTDIPANCVAAMNRWYGGRR